MRTLIFSLLVGLLVLVPASVLHAQQMPSFGPASQNTARLKADLAIADGSTAAPGETFTLVIKLTVQEHWKIQAGDGSGDEVEGSYPTVISVTPPTGWTVSKLRWPKAKHFDIAGIPGSGYVDTVTVEADITIPATAADGEHSIDVNIHYQACDATQCERPTDLEQSINITLEDNGDASAATDTTPPPVANDTPESPTTNDTMASTAPTAPHTPGRSTVFGFSLPDFNGPFGFVLLVLLSMVAGFVLNLTPCVLPVIPIKIMTISTHANSPGRSMMLGLAMAAGVVAFWVGIGIPAAAFSGFADPSRLFGIWWVTLGIGLIIGIMALGIMGLFLLQLPQSVYAINPKADNALGSFLFGVMTGVLGLPCFGFAAAGLLAGSATLPALTILAIFASIGVGMAAPYLVLSAKPALVNKIPRTGPASELVKQIMGLLLLAAAAYFIGSGLIALVTDKPYIARELHLWVVATFASLAGVWLIAKTFKITSSIGKRVAFSIVGLIIGGVALVFAMNATAKAEKNWLKLREMQVDGGTYVPGAWNEYSPEKFEAARAAGHIVVLDFTATWCINCKVLKATVLNPDPVGTALEAKDIVPFTVDLTSNSAPGWKLLEELGQTGIPQLFIYTPGSDTPWQSSAYTPQQVMSALEAARNTQVAKR